MPLLMKHTGPLWGIWKIEESSEVLLSLLRNREEYLPQLELIRAEQRRREWLACRVLLQELTGGPACIAYRPNGAPYLSGSSLHISISHTKGYAAVLLQNRPAAGIDIEYHSGRVSKIRSRFMKLNADHIRFVLKCLAENSSPIRNMKQYLLASLYNAPTTMQLSYQNQTNHDLAMRG